MVSDSLGSGAPSVVASFDPAAGTILAFGQPVLAAVTGWCLNRLSEVATDESGMSAEQIVRQLSESEGGLRLLARTIEAARTAISDEKLLVLGRCLVNGLRDDATLDEQLLLVGVVSALEAHHMRLLGVIGRPLPSLPNEDGTTYEPAGWMPMMIEAVDPALTGDVVNVLIGSMLAQGVVAAISVMDGTAYETTSIGRLLISLATERAAGPTADA
jgi:hypothetical protein